MIPNSEVGVTSQNNVMNGPISYKILVYEARPLSGMMIGQEFIADIIRKPVFMRSSLTGSTWSASQNGGMAIGYNGIPIGVTFNDDLINFLNYYRATRIMAKMVGWYDEENGIPEIRIQAPSSRFSEYDQITSGMMHVDLYEAKDMMIIGFAYYKPIPILESLTNSNHYARINVNIIYLPNKLGSKAKPTLSIQYDGGELMRFTARSGKYKELGEHTGPHTMLVQRNGGSPNRPEGFFYRIVILK
jgi:hypothetical protein